MATLHNPLHNFQSYSVHYILLATRTTEDAKAFADNSETSMAATLAAIDKTKKLGDPINYGNSDAAYLIIDTRRFSQFSIDNLKYEVLINGLQANQSHGNFATSLSFDVLDSVGISFINFIRWIMIDKMQTNYDGMLYMLRTIFVGHNPDGSTETVQSVTIPMHLIKMSLDLDHARGVYAMEFMPNVNFDTVRHDRWLTISNSTSYSTGSSNRLGDMINSFEESLNGASAAYYSKASVAMLQAGRPTNKNGQFGRLVQYQITMPREWEDYEYTGVNTINATETVFKVEAAKDANESQAQAQSKTLPPSQKSHVEKNATSINTSIAVPAGSNITTVLDAIFGQVKSIAENGTIKDGQVTFYKYLVGLTSTDAIVTVHVDVVPFTVPKVDLDAKANQASYNADVFYQTIDGKRVPKNYIEYDYIHTGKNTDILNFDMKIQDLQWLIASNMDMGPGQLTGVTPNTDTTNGAKADPANDELIYSRPYDPLLPPVNTAAVLENFSRYTSTLKPEEDKDLVKVTQDYARNLSMFYAASPITTNLTIKGNPLIMAQFNIKSLLPQPTGGGGGSSNPPNGGRRPAATSKEQYRRDLETQILDDNSGTNNPQLIRGPDGSFTVKSLNGRGYTTSPVFVKVNVFGPKVDFITNDLVNGDQFSEAVLQDNYYVVMKVVNQIEGSNFTQTMELYSHNVFGNGKYEPPATSTKPRNA